VGNNGTDLETSAAAHERLRAYEHHGQDGDEHHARGVGISGNEPEQFRIAGEQPLGHRESNVVQVRVVYDDGACRGSRERNNQ